MGTQKRKKDKAKSSKAAGENGSSKKVNKRGKLKTEFYEGELARLHTELVKLQYWVKQQGLRVVCLFEGRDAAGKGGVIKRIAEPLNPRACAMICSTSSP